MAEADFGMHKDKPTGTVDINTNHSIARISYNFNPMVAFVLSPQGDIAFSRKSELGTDNAWVWPITAGISFGVLR